VTLSPRCDKHMLNSKFLVNSTPRPLPLKVISVLRDIFAEPKGDRERECHNRERRRDEYLMTMHFAGLSPVGL
jgi:hypothetical protein